VVKKNLKNSFPEYGAEELLLIEKKYYHNLCDSIVETIKLLSMSKKSLNKRMTANWESVNRYDSSDRIIMAYLAHQFNWEWGTVVANWNLQNRFTGVHQPIRNTAFERLMTKIRTKSGSQIVSVKVLPEKLKQLQNEKIVWGFIADQNPSDARRASWNDFLNQKTAFTKGTEFIARRYNNRVFFGEIIKVKRGYYHLELKLAFDHARETKDGEITESYVRFLESSVKRQPENWVWSHRRWKHTYPNQA